MVQVLNNRSLATPVQDNNLSERSIGSVATSSVTNSSYQFIANVINELGGVNEESPKGLVSVLANPIKAAKHLAGCCTDLQNESAVGLLQKMSPEFASKLENYLENRFSGTNYSKSEGQQILNQLNTLLEKSSAIPDWQKNEISKNISLALGLTNASNKEINQTISSINTLNSTFIVSENVDNIVAEGRTNLKTGAFGLIKQVGGALLPLGMVGDIAANIEESRQENRMSVNTQKREALYENSSKLVKAVYGIEANEVLTSQNLQSVKPLEEILKLNNRSDALTRLAEYTANLNEALKAAKAYGVNTATLILLNSAIKQFENTCNKLGLKDTKNHELNIDNFEERSQILIRQLAPHNNIVKFASRNNSSSIEMKDLNIQQKKVGVRDVVGATVGALASELPNNFVSN
jgi:hypothetical protein